VAGRSFILIDTGGITGDEVGMDEKMAEQSLMAIEEADCVLFLVDARAGMTAADQMIAEHLRKRTSGDSGGQQDRQHRPDIARAEFSPLGMGNAIPVAGSQGRGINALMEALLGHIPRDAEEEALDQNVAEGEEAAHPWPERERWHQDRHHRPPERRQVDPGQPHAR
jgi:GTP-binding protein